MDENSDSVTTFGVLGCANIARKVIKAIKLSKNSKLIAIASRDKNKAIKYCIDNELPEEIIKYGNYEDLLGNNDIDVVYIPLPTSFHHQWVIRAASAGKHILIEKPVALNHMEFEEMLNACNKYNVFMMDGTMFMHHNRIQSLKQYLNNNNNSNDADNNNNYKNIHSNESNNCDNEPYCGGIKRINSSFSFPGDETFLINNIRVNVDADPLGALGDLGWYSVRMGVVAFSASSSSSGNINNTDNSNTSGEKQCDDSYFILKPYSCRCVCSTWSVDGVSVI